MPVKARTKSEVPSEPVKTSAPRAGRRAATLKRLAKATNVTFTLEPAVRRHIEGQAKAAGMDLTHFMQKLVETHILSTVPADDPLAMRLQAKRDVIDLIVARARAMDAAGQFDEHFILNVVTEAAKDPGFVQRYQMATTGEGLPDRVAQRARVSLNQQMGRLAKSAVRAKSKRNDSGKIMRAQTSDGLIATYTLLTKPG